MKSPDLVKVGKIIRDALKKEGWGVDDPTDRNDTKFILVTKEDTVPVIVSVNNLFESLTDIFSGKPKEEKE